MCWQPFSGFSFELLFLIINNKLFLLFSASLCAESKWQHARGKTGATLQLKLAYLTVDLLSFAYFPYPKLKLAYT